VVAVVSTIGHVINSEIQLSWTPSASSASHPVLNYKIYLSSAFGSTVIVTPDATASYNLLSLIDGTPYTITISGVNLVGEGAQCAAVHATPVGLVNYDPDAPNSASPGYQSVDLSFNAPSDIGGSASTSYTIMYSLDPAFVNNVTSVSVTGTTASVQDANLIIPYADRLTSTGWFYFKVCVVNAIGAGPYTSAVTLVADIIPNAVTSLAASNLDANGNHAPSTVTLSWSYAVDNSTPLLGYIIAYLDTSGEMVSVYVNDVSCSPSHTITGLENGTSYDFSVFGINMLGAGPSMDASATPSTVPDAPDLSLSHTSHAIQLAWSDPYDEGSAITGYNVYRSSNNASYTAIASNVQTASYNDTGLTNGSVYYYQVAAINSNGEGPRSAVAQEYPSTVPNAPTSICVADSNGSASGQQLTVSWAQAPADHSVNGGSVVIQ
jgi:hypothetical protein